MTHIDPKRVEDLDLFLENELAGGFSVEKTREFIISRESQKDEQIARLEAEKREAVEAFRKYGQHDWGCDAYNIEKIPQCSCGYSTFLSKSAQQSGR